MSTFYVVLLLTGLFTLAHCQHHPTYVEEEINQPLSAEKLGLLPYNKIAPGNTDFAFRLLKAVISTNAQTNSVISPLSISISLAMLSLGTKGRTHSQLLRGLGFNQTDIRVQEIHIGFQHLLRVLNSPKSEIELNVGDALFIDEKLKPLKSFLDDVHHFYQADISRVNFANPEEAEHQINSYIDEKTHGKLVDVVKGLDTRSVMILVNYFFMKACWNNPFNYLNTREDDFFVDERTTVRVPMMNRDGYFNYYHDTDLSCQVVQLLYKGNASAIFILPDPGKMKLVGNALDTNVLSKWLSLLKSRRIHLSLPKFSISGKNVFKGILRKVCIVDVFTDNADLSGISSSRSLKVSKVIQDVYLNVHENGTEAAAVTVTEIVPTSLPPLMKINRPFYMLILDRKTNAIFIAGKISNPKSN